jgi:hypothetical protein|tara:strand:+ start:414 stop:641 length:228 start_codon:yes stop_codon:yes gene_type:complete
MSDIRTVTVKDWNGYKTNTLEEYVKIWQNNAELSKLWIRGNDKSSELIIAARENIKDLATLNFEDLYQNQNINPS